MDIYMYWLSTLYWVGSRRQNRLLKHFGSAKEIYDATPEALRSVPGFTEYHAHSIEKSRNPDKIKAGLAKLQQMDISFTHLDNMDYPVLLKEIPDPPVGLFYLGDLPDSAMPHVSIIGSRRCSEYGLTVARRFGKMLAQQGVVVVSGMARGIDSMAHRGAIEPKNGLTIAVLGCGIDICYPAENRQLRDDIAKKGCVLSEYPPGTKALPHHFPARNRIISGLSQILIVVEAGKKSGTLITVDQALDQGRDVMAVPGNITNKYSDGTNALIKQGADPVCNYEDVLHMLGITDNKNKSKEHNLNKAKPDIASNEKLVYDVLTSRAHTLDEIVIKTNSKPQTIQYILTMLELKGYVKKLPGMKYVRGE